MLRRTILVAIGSNLTGRDGSSPRQLCAGAVGRLAALPGLHVVKASSAYRSDASPPSTQASYVNAAVFLQGNADPHELLNALHKIEAEAGRERSVPNAARTLDLDLLGVDDLVLDVPGLVLPHPRLHLRRFVLMPLAEIAPEWRHPVLHQTPPELLAVLPPDGTRILD